MACTKIERVAHEPILIFTYDGRIDFDALAQSFDAAQPQVEAILADGYDTLYSILDVRHGSSTFLDVIDILKRDDDTQIELNVLREMQWVMVGTDAMSKLYIDIARQEQYGGWQIPLFAHVDDALAAVRQMVVSQVKATR
ncbi:MAG: hypothetical protein SF162_01340 [bacterium]|nr:hypothetical protein [bacterium]